MYGRIHQRKIREDDYIMSCEKARQQLDSYINDESKRVNVDSAKKLAVLQHMDYDGFRQMVLGANIFSTKSKELYEFSKGNENQPTTNKVFLTAKSQNREKSQAENLGQDLASGSSEMQCGNFRDFKKKFMRWYDKQLDPEKATELYKYRISIMNLIKQQNQVRLNRIFNMECETNILVKVSMVFGFVLEFLRENKSELLSSESSYMAKFFQTVVGIPTMTSFSMNILTKGEKKKISETLAQIKRLLSEEDAEDMDKIIKAFQK